MPSLMGRDCKLYYNTGTRASPTWVEVCSIKDLTLNADDEEVDSSTRCDDIYGTTELAKRNLSIDFKYKRNKPEDAIYPVIFGYYWARTVKEWAVANGNIATAGTTGVKFFGHVVKATEGQPLNDTVMVDFTVKPSPHADLPTTFTTAGSSSA